MGPTVLGGVAVAPPARHTWCWQLHPMPQRKHRPTPWHGGDPSPCPAFARVPEALHGVKEALHWLFFPGQSGCGPSHQAYLVLMSLPCTTEETQRHPLLPPGHREDPSPCPCFAGVPWAPCNVKGIPQADLCQALHPHRVGPGDLCCWWSDSSSLPQFMHLECYCP